MNTTINDQDIVRGFLTQLETQQSLAAHNADMNWSHYMTDDGHRGIVEAQCYAFATQALRLSINNDGMVQTLGIRSLLAAFSWYMGHLQERSLESRNVYDKNSQKFVYDTFNLMAQIYGSIADRTENVMSLLESQKDANE